eukprot:1808906-Prymnesium_polylepis.1
MERLWHVHVRTIIATVDLGIPTGIIARQGEAHSQRNVVSAVDVSHRGLLLPMLGRDAGDQQGRGRVHRRPGPCNYRSVCRHLTRESPHHQPHPRAARKAARKALVGALSRLLEVPAALTCGALLSLARPGRAHRRQVWRDHNRP